MSDNLFISLRGFFSEISSSHFDDCFNELFFFYSDEIVNTGAKGKKKQTMRFFSLQTEVDFRF